MAKIWALFAVENNYDQPSNNLVCWWSAKPSIEAMASAVKWQFPVPGNDACTLAIVNIWAGTSARIGGTDYRLEQVEEGKEL